jgi:hypothetical protein
MLCLSELKTRTRPIRFWKPDRSGDLATGGTGDEGNYSETYTYKPDTGNLASKAGLSNGYNNIAHTHAVTHLGGAQKYWYDENGNQTRRDVGGTTYLTYDAENHLVNASGAATAEFIYDGDGNRVKSITGGTTTVFVGNYYEWTSTSTKKYYYAGATRLAMRDGNDLHYLFGDHLGSTSLTIYKETNSRRWATIGALMPLGLAFLVTFFTASVARFFGWV